MPELPEVETVRRGLAPAMEGGRLKRLVLNRPDLRFPLPEGLCDAVEGREIVSLGRRAKYLTIHFAGGPVLVCHLGMSGSFRVENDTEADIPGVFHHPRSVAHAHDHVIFEVQSREATQGTVRVIYNDPRRFGFMFLSDPAALESHPHLANLGVEPTGNALSADCLAERLAGKAAPMKAVLLDQSVIAGLGNIYVCEALWRAKISPRRAARTLVKLNGAPTARLEALTGAIRDVIAEAIIAGGSSLRDHKQTDGTLGYFQHSFAAYDREGHPCRHDGCPGTIGRIVQSGRSTFYCPSCQR